jgi:phosphoribosylaminoimidazole synthetase
LAESIEMSESYAAAGVDTGQADRAVDALVGVLRTIELDRPSASVLPSGHYASVLRVAPNLGIAVTTDGVGSKLVVAEEADRLETVGIDCVAMNVNDLICVGAEPIAMLDYLAVEQADPDALARIGAGLKVGAQAAGVEIPGGELAVLPELIRGHPSPHGFDLCGTAFGTVALDAIVTGAEAGPGDAIVGLPSSGLHSNGYTLARHALLDEGGLALDERPALLEGRSVADALLEPTVIYVRAVLERPAQPAALGRRSPRLRHRGPAARAGHLHAGRAARRRAHGRDVGRLQHGLRLRRAGGGGSRRRGRRAARRAPPGDRADRDGDRGGRPALGARVVGRSRRAALAVLRGVYSITEGKRTWGGATVGGVLRGVSYPGQRWFGGAPGPKSQHDCVKRGP